MKNILALVWWSDMHYATNTILSTWEKNSIFVEKCAQYLKFNFNFQFRLAKITSWAKNFVHPHLPESYPISLSWKQIPFDLQTKGTPHRRKTVFFRALPKLPLPTRAGCRWRAQLDVQISLQHSTLSGGGQGSLSTSFPHPTEGVEDAEELPMVSVKHLLDVWISTTAHILETKSELDKDLWSSKSCYWSLSLSAQQHSYTYRQVGTSWVRLFCATADGQRQHKLCTFTTLWKVNSFITWWKKSTHSPSYEKVNTLTIQWAHWEIK